MGQYLACFKAYDVRGKVPTEINPEIAYAIGRAYADQTGANKVCIGYDIRLSGPSLYDALAKGIQAHHLFSVQSLSGNFPSDADDAVLAYAESDSLVRYFIQAYGRDHLAILIAAFHAGNNPDEAFQATVGISAMEFQRGWQASLDARPAGSSGAQSPAPTGGGRFRRGPPSRVSHRVR